MNDLSSLLEVIKSVARSAGLTLYNAKQNTIQEYDYLPDLPCEMKAVVDNMLEREILERLIPVGLPILSEESGGISGKEASGLRFVVDPLDGTVNFIRDLGPSTVSISLCRGSDPILGALSIYPSGDLAWGGKGFGAYLNDRPIHVSDISDETKSVLCTGKPSRLNLENGYSASRFLQQASSFGKIRMLGSASISLLQVARGSAEIYEEQDIMLWDVAAGLALVEGAGGSISVSPGKYNNSMNVIASNGVINEYN